jgi:hypothetical protein
MLFVDSRENQACQCLVHLEQRQRIALAVGKKRSAQATGIPGMRDVARC